MNTWKCRPLDVLDKTYQIDCFASLESYVMQVAGPRASQDAARTGKERWVFKEARADARLINASYGAFIYL